MSDKNMILSQLRWPSLAQDLAVMTTPGSPIQSLAVIYQTYNVSQEDLKQILKIPRFQAMLKASMEEMREQGGKGGVRFRSMMLSQALAEKLFREANANNMEHKDALKLLEILMKSAGLMDNKEAQVNTQVNVGVQLPLPRGLNNPKLKHMEVKDV